MTYSEKIDTRDVYVVGGCRTPFIKTQSQPGPFSAADLAVYAGRDLLAQQSFAPTDIDEVIAGCVMPGVTEANIARIIALRLGCGQQTPAWTVQRNCASGLQAIDSGYRNIAMGRSELVLAGGTEAMSRAPVLFNDDMVHWMARFMSAKTLRQKTHCLAKLRPRHLRPVLALLKGLTDPLVGLSMGQTAENLAYKLGIGREMMDHYAMTSQQRLASAQQNRLFNEIVTIYDRDGRFYATDDGVRPDTSMEKLARLKPYFDKPFGQVTAGNSSQISDGAAWVLLASAKAVKRYGLPVVARIKDSHWAGCAPEEMGLGPVYATTPLLKRQQLSLHDIDYWEINEAFAAQVLACLKVWESAQYCRDFLGLNEALGSIDRSRLNVDGGAISIGHPVGASGARLVLHLIGVLRRHKAKRGIASLCIGGGLGGSMLIENTSEVVS